MELKKPKFGIRTSLENFGRIGNIEIYPLYAIENFSKKSNLQKIITLITETRKK